MARKKYTQEEFIEKAIKVHGDKYDYSKVYYINSSSKVIITCPIHGDFEQAPYAHLQGQRCFYCGEIYRANLHKSNTEEFIEKARKIHGDRYDYGKVVYINNIDKVIITCPIHGEFEQIPNNHLLGCGCSKCKNVKIGNLLRLDGKEFIEKAKLVHGDIYDYSKVIYIHSHTKVTIICPEHGEFLQVPNNHLNGKKCLKCILKKRTISKEEFIRRAITIHGDKYDYNKVIYLDSRSKIIITCPIHGDFKQNPHNHLHSKGCPICKSSKGELAIIDILKKHKIKFRRQYLIPQIVNKLYYDFYLPKLNILIEFHGIQHYEHIPYFHRTEDKFLAQKTRDDVIRSNARQFRYRYLEFNYLQLKQLSKEQFEELILLKITSW